MSMLPPSLPAPLRAVVKEKEGFVTPTETNLHGDALCFVVKIWARHKTTEASLNNGCDWWLVAVDGGWLAVAGGWRLAVGGWWRLVLGGGWRLAVGG